MIDWSAIDTVLLDMDGTLLDLHFDNYFWLEYLPARYAAAHGISFDASRAQLFAHFKAHQGTLNWYCLEFWSDALSLDIQQLKVDIKHKIKVRPFVTPFLQALRQSRKRLVLITNAHPQSLSLKMEVTRIDGMLDMIISSHDYRHPKEAQAFWQTLQFNEPFDKQRTLFIDDSLAVLDSAHRYGIQHLLSIHQPDSLKARRISKYPAIEHFNEIMPSPSDLQRP